MSFTSWPAEHAERLKVLFAEGLSSSQIAHRLNTEFSPASYSRNAVIGRVHRMGLNGRATASAPRRTHAPVVARARPTMPKGVGAFVLPPLSAAGTSVEAAAANAAAKAAAPDPGKAFTPLPGTQPRLWTERPFMACAWPVGGDGADTLSCCEPTDGRSYCAKHARIAYAGVPARKQEALGLRINRWRAA